MSEPRRVAGIQERADLPAQRAKPVDLLRVVVIDDHAMLAELLVLALAEEPDLTCVGHALTAVEGLELVARTDPDVVIMDYRLPDMDGVRATAALLDRAPETRVVMLTAADPRLAAQAAAAGAVAFVPKSAALSDVQRGAPRDPSLKSDDTTRAWQINMSVHSREG